MQRDLPYKIYISDRGNLEVVVHGFRIGVIYRKRMTYLEYRNGKFLRAGVWELVINKDEFPREEQGKPTFYVAQKYAY